MNVFDFNVKDREGKEVSLSKYKGKVLLIVNSATECGFTPQYADLQGMYDKWKDKNFEILDFPCNQFGNQAPGTNEEILSFCNSRYGITFPIFCKIDVNGENAAHLYHYLQEQKKFQGFDKGHPLTKVLEEMLGKENPEYAKQSDIKWNFTKFLVDRDGNVVERFEPTADMKDVEKRVEELL